MPDDAEFDRSASIEKIIGQYIRLEQAGKTYRGLCPFDDSKLPRFMIDPATQTFRCMICGKRGNVHDFVRLFSPKWDGDNR
jgi:DNA primase